jgi:hypothetical protein
MQQILYVIMFFIVMAFVVKLSFSPAWVIALTGLLLGVFVLAVGSYAPQQSKTQLADLLNNPSLMLDVSVWISLESLLGIAFCFVTLRSITGSKWKYTYLLNAFPGLLILPILFWLITQTVFAFPGKDFTFITRSMAGMATAGIVGFSFFIKWLIPEKSIRLEILFISWIFILILGIISTVNGRPLIQGTHVTNLPALLSLTAMAAGFFLMGFVWFYIRKSLFHK